MFDFQAADEGEYQCLAESEAGTAERTITLKVQGEFVHMRNKYTEKKPKPKKHLY